MNTDAETAYNATVGDVRRIHDELIILRIKSDSWITDFAAGQYTTLGLLASEPRINDDTQPAEDKDRLIRRAYSISHPILDESDTSLRLSAPKFLEFYIALVKKGTDVPPSLTPRIFALNEGDRLFMGTRPKGTYTLQPVSPNDDVIFVATGTGEAPHNAMIAELFRREHQGRIASFVCVRHDRDLAYLKKHRGLERLNLCYRYVPLTTREPVNMDVSHAGFIGKKYVQEIFGSAELKTVLGWVPQPTTTHVFLCGNPAMIGAPERRGNGPLEFSEPRGMVKTLIERGFCLDSPHVSGNIHFERYW